MDVPASLVREWYLKLETLRAADAKEAQVRTGQFNEKGQEIMLAERRELLIRGGLMVPNDQEMRDFLRDEYPNLQRKCAKYGHVEVTAPSGIKIPVKSQAEVTLRMRVKQAVARLRGEVSA